MADPKKNKAWAEYAAKSPAERAAARAARRTPSQFIAHMNSVLADNTEFRGSLGAST